MLDEDADLAELIPEPLIQTARQASLAATVDLPAGRWDASEHADRARDGYGLLALDGILVRRVGYADRYGAELLPPAICCGRGTSTVTETLGFESTWRVLAGTRLAVLDIAWTERMTRYTKIGPALAGRALSRSRRLAAMMAISQQPRLDERLWMLFWELADRHGRVHPDGIYLDLPLTHEVLSHLVAARRPSVSGALTKLADQGRLRREGRRWVLSGDPPG